MIMAVMILVVGFILAVLAATVNTFEEHPGGYYLEDEE